MVAFQAVDPGSTPGRRTFFFFPTVVSLFPLLLSFPCLCLSFLSLFLWSVCRFACLCGISVCERARAGVRVRDVFISVCVRAYLCVCARVGVGKTLCVYACVRACMCVCVCARTRERVCAREHVRACVCGGGGVGDGGVRAYV